ncbi:hypothetical protein TRVL_06745 [Trypanosoma vivax]|nr:hypothetical protein TRVL_06745 [Trypanosoma vivax]
MSEQSEVYRECVAATMGARVMVGKQSPTSAIRSTRGSAVQPAAPSNCSAVVHALETKRQKRLAPLLGSTSLKACLRLRQPLCAPGSATSVLSRALMPRWVASHTRRLAASQRTCLLNAGTRVDETWERQ